MSSRAPSYILLPLPNPPPRKTLVLQILVRGICGYPPIVSQYQPRIGKGLTPGAMRDEQRGQQRWKTGYGRSCGAEEGNKQRNSFSLSLSLPSSLLPPFSFSLSYSLTHGAPAIRNSILKAHRVNTATTTAVAAAVVAMGNGRV